MRAIPFIALLGWLATPVVQAADAQEWLQRMAQSSQQSFHGTFVYERNGNFSTHAIWHQAGAQGVRERLLQLDGPIQEVVRVDGRPQCVSGGLADEVPDVQWPAPHLQAAQLGQRYEFRLLGKSRIAGRAAVVLLLVPRDQHRYAFELHLDEETALPLKSLLISEKGQLLERFQFVDLDLSAVPGDEVLRPSEGCKPVALSKVAELAQSWRAGWLPPGFELKQALQRPSPASADPVACLMYGDGLARFSVFLEPLRGAVVDESRNQLGPTAVVSRRMSTADGDVMVTVVGEIPLGTAERIALSMQEPAATAQAQ
ncbi:RNA polymerase subunit sigma [Pseudomonas alcaligenes]|uniref:RNA polymerase subunit sigma n=1 Tax=Aquipseudomonas alcaligenes TaxID=43263 RepID=A0ABR7S0M6_AQUAC|nr:MucB/RseB C-terminal domain-containing protein [Pseudomonas alcaligenes]MBC9249943.1 RNA polymerase subunit sigma [Pseudomonas alcaligenes]